MIGPSTLFLLLLAATPPGVARWPALAPPVGADEAPDPEAGRSDGAPAGPSRDSVLVLPEVRVEGERPLDEARRRAPTTFATTLAAAASGRALERLDDLLVQAAGVRVVQYGGLGAFSTVSLRGAPAGQVAVYLDGVPLTSAGRTVVNLADLPLTAIERVEIYRGVTPASLGPVAPGGAIRLVSASGARPFEARLTRGSFDTWEGRASGGVARGPLALLAHAGVQSSRGDFAYFDDNGTPLNLADDQTSRRENNRFDATSAIATATWTPARGNRVTVREEFFRKAQGVPGIGANPAHSTRLAVSRSITALEAEREPRRAWPGLSVRAALRRERTRFRDLAPQGELGLGRHDADDHLAGEEAALTVGWPRLPLGLALEATGGLRAERAGLRDAADPYADPPPSRRDGRGGGVTLQWRALGERVLLHAARRWDRLEDRLAGPAPGSAAAPAAVTRTLEAPQAGARVTLGGGLEARANWSDAGRPPDFLELFGNQGSVLGNPALVPERTTSWDAGLAWSGAWRGAHAALEWAHHRAVARDLILYARTSQSSVRAQNVTRARLRGEELSVRVRLPGRIALAGSASWQSALDDGPIEYRHGKRLPQHPERTGSLWFEAPIGPLRVTGDLQYLGDDYLDRSNRQRAPSRTLIGATIGWTPVNSRLRLTLEGKNLSDRRVSDVGGFPLPGRSVFLACETRLGPAEPIRR